MTIPISKPAAVSAGNVPATMRDLPHWGNHLAGKPINSRTGQYAKCNDSATWSPFPTAWNKRKKYDGVSFALTEASGIVGIDLDDCRDPVTGKLTPQAQAICKQLNSYTEVSPSGKGIRIFVYGKIPANRNNQKDKVEVYSKNKFLTVTTQRLTEYSATVEHRPAELAKFYKQYFPAKTTVTTEQHGGTLLNGWVADPTRVPSFDKLLRKFPQAEDLLNGIGNDDDSAREQGLANYLLASGCSYSDAADGLVHAREKAGQEAKCKGYYEATLRTALSSNLVKQSAYSLKAYLQKNLKSGTDDVKIGESFPPPECSAEFDEILGSSLADAAKQIQGIKYLVRGYVPFGMLTAVVAEPGKAKSAFVLFGLVRPILTGCHWFTHDKGPKPGKVLWLSTENDMAITVQRMRDWKIPMQNLILPFADDPLRSINLSDPEHLVRIETLIVRHKIQLAVVDSLRGGHTEDENNSRVAEVLQALAVIAERTKAAIVIVHHARKLQVDEELTANSSRGSNAILAMFRSQIGIDMPDPKSQWRRIRVLKENLGIAPQPVGFLVSDKGLEFGTAPTKPHKKKQIDDAVTWLRKHMKAGKDYKAGELIDEAEQHGLLKRTIQRAATEKIGIEPKKQGKDWIWRLPKATL